MKRATDLIPHDIAMAAVKGLSSGWGLSPFLSQALAVCVGPMRYHVDEEVSFLTKRGILMGSGTTWPILSLYNLWLWDTAWTQCYGFVLPSLKNRVRIVGDDLLGVAPEVVSQQYTSLLVRTGGFPSEGKDLQSSKFGVLIEKLISVRTGGYTIEIPTISVRSIQPVPNVVGKDGIPPWAMGSQLSTIVEKAGRPFWLITLIGVMYGPEISMLRSFGFPPFVPRELGGGGFPCVDTRSCIESLPPRWKRAIRCAMSQGSNGELLLSKLSRSWSTRFETATPQWVMNFVREAQVASVSDIRDLEIVKDDEGSSSFSDCFTRAVSMVDSTYRLLGDSTVRKTFISPEVVRKRLAEALVKLNSLVPYPRLTDHPKDLTQGILVYLHKISQPVREGLVLMDLALVMSAILPWGEK